MKDLQVKQWNDEKLIVPTPAFNHSPNIHIGQQITLGKLNPFGVQIYTVSNITSKGIFGIPIGDVIFK